MIEKLLNKPSNQKTLNLKAKKVEIQIFVLTNFFDNSPMCPAKIA